MIKGKIISDRELMFTETTIGRWRFHKNDNGEWLTESGEKATIIPMDELLNGVNTAKPVVLKPIQILLLRIHRETFWRGFFSGLFLGLLILGCSVWWLK